MKQRIITRPDFDGVVCAVLLKEAVSRDLPVLWAQPNEVQNGRIQIFADDIIANLPSSAQCALWFDHHISNEVQRPYRGLYRVAPSAAGLIHQYFNHVLGSRFDALIAQTDKIDDAQLNLDEIQHPERYPYILVSMSITTGSPGLHEYCDHLVELLRTLSIDRVLADPLVQKSCDRVIADNKAYETHLKRHTIVRQGVSITDFRKLNPAPDGNRFLVYSLFPDAFVNMKIYGEKNKIVVKIGHSIVTRKCNVNVGCLLAGFGGGGHRGAGACRLDNDQADSQVYEIMRILIENRPEQQMHC